MALKVGRKVHCSTPSEVAKPSDLRVMIFTPSYQVLDGVTLTLRKIRREVESQGGLVQIVTCMDAKKYTGNDPCISYWPCLSLPYDSHDNYSVCRVLTNKTKKEILDFKPNVLHITAPDPLCYSVCRWARMNGLPLMATWHSNIPDYFDHMGWFQRNIVKPALIYIMQAQYSYCPLTFVPQPKLMEKMRNDGYESKVTGNQLRVWGRGVDTDLFNPAKRSKLFRNAHGASDDDVVVLWVGRCVCEKKPQVWKYVLQHLTAKYPNRVRGWVVGRGEEYDEMVSISNVTGFGWKNREDLAQIYANSDILLFPSTVETFGNVTLEAMASGLPCVVDETSSSHLIKHGKIGFTCKTSNDEDGTNEEYFMHVETIVNDNALRKAMSTDARKEAVANWQLKVILNQMVQNYIEVANCPADMNLPFQPELRHRLGHFIYSLVDLGGPVIMSLIGILAFYSKSRFSQFCVAISVFAIVYLIVQLIDLLLQVFF